MKTLRGRPRTISESGIIYVDSDTDDSDVSDSDVEPVFFPAVGFDFNGEVFEVQEFLPPVSDVEDDSSSSDVESLFELVQHELNDNNGSANVNPQAANGNRNNEEVILQFYGGTVQVRHIVNENFAQLQQELAQNQSRPQSAQELVTNAVEGERNRFIIAETSSPPPAVAITRGNNQNQESVVEEDLPSLTTDSPIVISISNSLPYMDNTTTESITRTGRDSGDVSTGMEQGNKTVKVSPLPDPVPESVGKSSACKDGLHGGTSLTGDTKPGTSSSARLVPYADLLGKYDGMERDGCKDLQLKEVRLSLKRKEPEDSDSDNENENTGGTENNRNDMQQAVAKSSWKAHKNCELSDEEEETCNPMVSEDEDEAEGALRGDRIGSTVYSERHVLKILMKWIEVLPSYSLDRLLASREEKASEEKIEKEILRLENDFEEQMSLLWDMSTEPDVMNFLVEHKVFVIVRNTIDNSVCNRLTEVSLGILTNIISEPSIIEDFTVHDSSLQIVEKVVELCSKVTDVAVLIQSFCLLRRICWYLCNVGTMKKWTDLLVSTGFLECSNFIMSSSTNALLLGNVIMLFFTLLDSLNPEVDDEIEGEYQDTDHNNDSSSSDSIPPSSRKEARILQLAKNYEPFCKTAFVPALCEGLKELMKNPKPSNTRGKLTSTREKPACPSTSTCRTDEHNADDIDIPIPAGHVQQAILKGLSTLSLLQKAPNGQVSLKTHASQIIPALLDFYRAFTICTEAITRSNSLEYFALSLHLLSFCHSCLDAVNTEAILYPVSTASKLMNQEEKDKEVDMVIRVQLKDGVEFDSVSYIALVVHEYLATVAEKFGPDCALEARHNTSHAKFFAVLDKVIAKFTDEK